MNIVLQIDWLAGAHAHTREELAPAATEMKMGVMDRNRLCHCTRSQRSNFRAEPRIPPACRVFADGHGAVAGGAAAGDGLRQTGPAPDPGDASCRGGGIIIYEVLSSFFSTGCGGGSRFCDAPGGTFLQDASHGWSGSPMIRVVLCKCLNSNWRRLPGTGFSRPAKQPNRVTHLFRVCRIIILDVLSSFFSVGCGGGTTLGDARGGLFLQCASPP
jgi:hypothetical protein